MEDGMRKVNLRKRFNTTCGIFIALFALALFEPWITGNLLSLIVVGVAAILLCCLADKAISRASVAEAKLDRVRYYTQRQYDYCYDQKNKSKSDSYDYNFMYAKTVAYEDIIAALDKDTTE
jgi:multisubunit Na+/H+ antiporter MnhG subunit